MVLGEKQEGIIVDLSSIGCMAQIAFYPKNIKWHQITVTRLGLSVQLRGNGIELEDQAMKSLKRAIEGYYASCGLLV